MACKPQPRQQAGCRTGGQRTGQFQSRMTYPSSQGIGTRQEAISEAKDHLITEVNKVDVGTEATALHSLLDH